MTALHRTLVCIGMVSMAGVAQADRGDSWGGGMGAIPYFDQAPGWNEDWVYAGSGCEYDTDGTGAVDVGDLLAVIGGWGTDTPDFSGDGVVSVEDLLLVIQEWGPCGGAWSLEASGDPDLGAASDGIVRNLERSRGSLQVLLVPRGVPDPPGGHEDARSSASSALVRAVERMAFRPHVAAGVVRRWRA